MARTETAFKTSVLPGMIEMKVPIATTRVVPDPPVVMMDVGSIWMSRLVAITLGRIRMMWLVVMFLGDCPPRNLSGTWTVRRNVSSADGMSAPACLATAMSAASAALLSETAPCLAESGDRTQQQ